MSWRDRAIVAVCLVAVYVIVGVVAPRAASAATYLESCPSPSAYTAEAAVVAAQSCAVQAERLEAIETTLEAQSAGSGAQVVALAPEDGKRLDLIWLTVALCGGITFGMSMFGWRLAREARGWGGGM